MYESKDYPDRVGLLLELEGYENGGVTVWLEAVSYTHLDVYKRQE